LMNKASAELTGNSAESFSNPAESSLRPDEPSLNPAESALSPAQSSLNPDEDRAALPGGFAPKEVGGRSGGTGLDTIVYRPPEANEVGLGVKAAGVDGNGVGVARPAGDGYIEVVRSSSTGLQLPIGSVSREGTPAGVSEAEDGGGLPQSERDEQFERLRLAAPSLQVARPNIPAAAAGLPGALRIPKEWLARMQKGR
jgi:hypothetical protein